MLTTIISNNCMGGVICSRHHMQFKSPTVALQILPEEFPKFCDNLTHYIESELVKYPIEEFTEEHKRYALRMYNKIPNEFPYGRIDDIMVCFQHYKTFEEAKEKWDRRKARIEWDHLGYVMHSEWDRYKPEIKKFLDLNLPHSVALTKGFSVFSSYRHSYQFTVPEVPGIDDFGSYNGKWVVEICSHYNEEEFLRGE